MRVAFHKYSELFIGKPEYFQECFKKHKKIWSEELDTHEKIEKYHQYYNELSKISNKELEKSMKKFKESNEIVKEYTAEIVLLERILEIKKG